MAMVASVNLLMLTVVLVSSLVTSRNRKQANRALSENSRFLGDLSEQLRQLAVRILRLGDHRLLEEGTTTEELAGRVREAGEGLGELAVSIQSYTDLMEVQNAPAVRSQARRKGTMTSAPSRAARNGIILTLLCSLVIVLFFTINVSAALGTSRMNRDADRFENQLGEWIIRQKGILYLFTDVISSQPQLMENYDEAVHLLSDMAADYPEISACYMANPYAEHPVIMNTGWIPGEDERPETRPWYRDTERAPDGFNISAPYLDAQTGNYCITLSRVVYGEKREFLGIFGIDFFLDQMIHVLGESYTSRSYAFLVDSDGVIINHPNEAYQMAENRSVSVEDTEYAEACNREGVTMLRDYSGHLVSCLSRKTDSGFTVLVANRWWSIFGSAVIVTLTFLALFGFCITIIILLINRLIRWQESINQQLKEAAEAAVSAGKAKSQFLAQMSHEIRTPMNAIIGLDNIALRDPDLTPRTRDDLEKIGASARHLLALINDILDMSRIESGRMELKENTFLFGAFLEQINVMINGQCQDKGLRYQCTSLVPAQQCFIGDDLKLKQVLINILGNSVKFTDPPGCVTFFVEQTSSEDGPCRLVFTMKDTGVGMDQEFIPKLFEAFSQEDSTSTNRYGGSGLGMSITKSIVEMMGGEI